MKHETEQQPFKPVITPPAAKLADPPHPWAVMVEFMRQLMTVGGVLLAVSVPFYKEVLGGNPQGWRLFLLGWYWVSLASSLALAVWCQGLIPRLLRAQLDMTEEQLRNRCRWSYYLFLFAMFLFVVLALGGIAGAKPPKCDAGWRRAATLVGAVARVPVESCWVGWIGPGSEPHTTLYRLAVARPSRWDWYEVVLNDQTDAVCSLKNRQLPDLAPAPDIGNR